MDSSPPEDLFDPATAPYLREEALADGQVLKRVLREGTGDILPDDVTVIWAYKEGRTLTGKSFQKYCAFVFKLGKKASCVYNQGEHVLFASMRRGEECWALVSQSMHQITDYMGQDLWFRINIEEYLEDIPDSIPATWNFAERRIHSEQCVTIANRLFGTKKYNQAGKLYNRSIQALQMKKDLIATLPPSDLDFIEQTNLRCWKNLAVTELKASDLCQTEKERLGKYSTVIENCKRVLAKTPQDVKALYLMAKAHMLRDEFEITRKIVRDCAPPVPADLTALLQEITLKEEFTRKKETQRMRSIFNKDVWEAEENSEKEFKQQQERRLKLEERTAEKERKARREQKVQNEMDATLEKAKKGFVIDLHDPDEDSEKFLDMMERVGETERVDETERVGETEDVWAENS